MTNSKSSTRLTRLQTFWGIQFAIYLAIGLVWQYAAASGLINPLFIGTPSKIAAYLGHVIVLDPTFVEDLTATLLATILAFTIGSIAAILTGLVIVTRPLIGSVIDPLIAALNSLPRIALAPLFLLWFGLGIASKVALGVSLTFFVVLSSTVAGAKSTDPDALTLARTLGANGLQTFFRVTLPSAIPSMFSGLRLGLVYALLGVISGEIIAAEHGIGQRLTYLAATFNIDGVFAVLLFLAVLGSLLSWSMTVIENRLLKWR